MDFKDKNKTILVTGAGGFLGGELIKQLSKEPNCRIVALTSKNKKDILKLHEENTFKCFDLQDFKEGLIISKDIRDIDVLIHCAFTTSSDGERLASSLNYAKEIFEFAEKERVHSIINISTRSIYGSKSKPLWTESTPVDIEDLYAMAKYSSELLLTSICKNTNHTNIRLSSLLGKRLERRVVNKFVGDAFSMSRIKIIGGKQVFSYMDVRDAARGIIALLSVNSIDWKEIYNLGTNQQYNIVEIAEMIADIAKDYVEKPVNIEVEEKDIYLNVGMDSSFFYKETGWTPKYSMGDTIVSIFDYLKTNTKEENTK